MLAACALMLAAAPAAYQDSVRSVWNLTFLEGSAPDLTAERNSPTTASTGKVGINVTTLTSALEKAFGVSSTRAAETGEPEFKITSVGNSLVIEGAPRMVQEVRRLLATQIDIAQSQVLLELDTYQVSSDRKTAEENQEAAKKLLTGQGIARLYKSAYLNALSGTVYSQQNAIREVIGSRSADFNVPQLFEMAGISDPSERLGLTEILLYLAYIPDTNLRAAYAQMVSAEFDRAHEMVERTMLEPLRLAGGLKPGEAAKAGSLLDELTKLNDTIHSAAARLTAAQDAGYADRHSPLLGSFARGGAAEGPEDRQTRRAIEEFLLTWMVTARQDVSMRLLDQGSWLTDGSTRDTATLSVLRDTGVANTDRMETLPTVLRMDHVAGLMRASMKVDSLLETVMRALDSETRLMIDEPLTEWIERAVLLPGRRSDFGFRFGGTTRLVVTSRTAGYTGAEAVSFFPFQPTSPIQLDDLIPMLSGGERGEGGRDAGPLTPLEHSALQAAFDQANKPPFYRSITPGIKFSVLPTMLPSGAGARLQVKLDVSVTPTANEAGERDEDQPAPMDLVKSMRTETELLANSLDTTSISSLKLTTTAPGKRDWTVPVLSQILPIRSWFVGPTRDQTKQHEAIVVIRVVVVPKAMDLASRFLGG